MVLGTTSMHAISSSTRARLRIPRLLVLMAVACGVIALQIGLPWLSYRCASDSEDLNRDALGLPDQRGIWNHLRFRDLLAPEGVNSHWNNLGRASMAVCQNEIIIVWSGAAGSSPSTIDRINLRTGQVTSVPKPPEVAVVLSDGHRIWWLPKDALLVNGCPTRFETEFTRRGTKVRLVEFVEGVWRPSDRYFIAPYHGDLTFEVDVATGRLSGFVGLEWETFLFRFDIDVEPENEHTQRLNSIVEIEDHEQLHDVEMIPEDRLRELGWYRCRHPDWLRVRIGHWVERQCVSFLCFDDDEFGNITTGFQVYRFTQNGHVETVRVPSPLRALRNGVDRDMRLVTSADGHVYLVCQSTFDGRWTVLQWDNGHFDKVIDQRSPLLGRTCIDASLFLGMSIAVPMLLLGLLGQFIQLRRSLLMPLGAETVILATVGRRGLARMIDLLLYVFPLVLSVVLHPEAIEWWEDTFTTNSVFLPLYVGEFLTLVSNPTVAQFSKVRGCIQSLVSDCLKFPVLWSLAGPAIAVGVGQTVWQGHSGRSAGKWLLGLRVIRTTGRSCGWSRSLLREILLAVESLCLLTWVPGVICILATGKSQRFGDLLAGTIVISDPQPMRVPT